ncbi:hypothetical protein EXIGLDRAFT_729287, partial [Exidia glandulosa HHB12029]
RCFCWSVVGRCSFGWYHVVYGVRFFCGSWCLLLLRFAAWLRVLRCGFFASFFIASRTSLPVPKLHAYSLDCDNALGHPYMIMDFARGTRLVDVWYDKKWWTGARSKTNTLRSLARHMVELSSIEFDRIGPDYPLGPSTTQHEYLRALAASLQLGMPNPYSLMVELFIGTLPDPRYDSAPFTLGHPDLVSQNVFMDDDTGEVSALIDWDGVAVVPRQLGALRYPSWLTVDWDPVAYEEYKDADEYDHADELHVYRAAYFITRKELWPEDEEDARNDDSDENDETAP